MSETATDTFQLGFVCVQNAGRSQMSTAFAEREVERRDLDDRVGSSPAARTRRITSTRRSSP
ncbi:MAG: protein-tyrosine-phosphatase [Halonotius sp. J07HN4]|nr:MAG: protein-tyrosine-phosphatase [Halonotius sp. J07HN4]